MVRTEWRPVYEHLCTLKNQAISDEICESYYQSLHLFSALQVRQAVRQCVNTLTWMPQPNEIRDAIPEKRMKVQDWDRVAGLDQPGESIWDKGGDVSSLSDQEILDGLMKHFGQDWLRYLNQHEEDKRLRMVDGYPSQAWNMLREARKGIKYICDLVTADNDHQAIEKTDRTTA